MKIKSNKMKMGKKFMQKLSLVIAFILSPAYAACQSSQKNKIR